MKICILFILGILSAIYGILVRQIGSGTSFWMIWELIGVFFLFWAFLVQKGFFISHRGISITFHTLVIIGIAVIGILCGMIAKDFRAKGEKNLDYIIVLGAQMREDGPSTVLKYRLDKAIEYLNDNPDTICIVSGGQGPNEPYPEAEGMYEYLVENGIGSERILVENNSNSTVENIIYSRELMEEDYNGVGIITNNFHVHRALEIAQKKKLEKAYGIAAKSNTLYLPNNMLRECLSIMKALVLGNI